MKRKNSQTTNTSTSTMRDPFPKEKSPKGNPVKMPHQKTRHSKNISRHIGRRDN